MHLRLKSLIAGCPPYGKRRVSPFGHHRILALPWLARHLRPCAGHAVEPLQSSTSCKRSDDQRRIAWDSRSAVRFATCFTGSSLRWA